MKDFPMGLVHEGPYLMWSSKKGWFRSVPYPLQRTVVHFWNLVACRTFGHAWMPDWKELLPSERLVEDDEGHKSIHYDWALARHRVCIHCSKRERLYTL